MPPPADDHPETFGQGGGGGQEVPVVAWPLLFKRTVPSGVRRRLRGSSQRIRESDRYRWWVLWTVVLGLLSVNITFTIFAVALERIAREFGTTTNTLTWVITGPLLGFGVLAPTLGRAGDTWGHRRLYIYGLAGALVCAALSSLAWSAGSLIAIRTLGGIEGAATGAASMALIFRAFEREDRVKAMGWWSLVGAGGPVIGVVIGGPLIEAIGWRWIFAAQVPLIAAALVASVIVLRETPTEPSRGFDWLGIATLTTASVSFLFALNRGPEWGWSSPAVVAGFALSPIAAVLFAIVEGRVQDPLLPLDYLRRRNFTFPIAANVFGNFAYMGGFILAPLLLAKVFDYGESRIGLMVIARPLMFSIVAPIAGYFTVRMGERIAAVVGMAAVAASMLVFGSIDGRSSDLVIISALALSGIGLGVATPAISAAIANSVDEARLGIASAAQQLMTQIALVAGIQLMQTVQASTERSDGLVPSFSNAYRLGAGVALLAVVCAFFVRREERSDRAGPGTRERGPGGPPLEGATEAATSATR